MKVINTSQKIIFVGNTTLMPGDEATIANTVAQNPAIQVLAKQRLLELADEKATVVEKTANTVTTAKKAETVKENAETVVESKKSTIKTATRVKKSADKTKTDSESE